MAWPVSPIQPKPLNKSCALTDPEIVKVVLLSDPNLSAGRIALKYGLSSSNTLRILLGQRHADLFPEIPRRKPIGKRTGLIPEETIIEILQSHGQISNIDWERKIGYSQELISQIRRGLAYAKVAPHIPRAGNGRQTCTQCVHNIKDSDRGSCSLGFTERIGIACPAFARESFLT